MCKEIFYNKKPAGGGIAPPAPGRRRQCPPFWRGRQNVNEVTRNQRIEVTKCWRVRPATVAPSTLLEWGANHSGAAVPSGRRAGAVARVGQLGRARRRGRQQFVGFEAGQCRQRLVQVTHRGAPWCVNDWYVNVQSVNAVVNKP